MSASPDSHAAGPTSSKGNGTKEAGRPTGPKRRVSRTQRLRTAPALQGQNLWYALLVVWMLILLGQLWYERTQVTPIP